MPHELRAIRREHLEAWIVSMQRGNAPHRVVRVPLGAAFFKWPVEENEIDRNPMDS